MISIRRKLTISIISGLIVVNIIMSILMYFSSFEEISEIYDENMMQIAKTISYQADHIDFPDQFDGVGRKGFHSETEFLIQIWKNNDLIYTSLPIMEVPKQDFEGYAHGEYQKKSWYFYVLHRDDLTVQISQPWSQRIALFLEIYARVLIPIVLQLPILIFLIRYLIKRGMRPLTRVSNMIEARNPDYLEPIPLEDTPKEILSMVRALNALLLRLSEALAMQRRFTADAAHELRTPLTAVKLQLDLAGRAKTENERRDTLRTLNKGVKRAIRLVEQLLSLARQEPEAVEQEWKSLSLTSLVNDLLVQFTPIAREKHIDLSGALDPDIRVEGQFAAIQTMVSNLVHNAIIYTPEGGEVQVVLTTEDRKPILEIRDTGIGIAVEERTRIFDRFYRVIGSTVGGSGLGLSIVKAVADRHNVLIEIASNKDSKGSVFRLTFPVTA